MKILYANVIELNAGWGAEYFLNQGFNKLGHETYSIDYRKHRDALYIKFRQAPLCDVFFLQRGDYFPIPIIDSIRIPRIFWASELVSRCRDQDRLLRSRLFSHIFLHTKSCIDTIVEKKWVERETCSVLLNGFDETLFKPIPEVIKDIDVLFVGTITPRREICLNRIGRVFNIEVVSAFGEKMSEVINRAKIILNIHAEEYLDTETRVFEVLGCGGFLLTERLSPENPFTDEELVQFDTIDDCMDKISFYLKEQGLRETIAQKGHQTACHKHTYTVRASEIVETMSPYVQSSKKPDKNVDELLIRFYGLEELVRRNIIIPGYETRDLLIQKTKSIIKKL